jgi:hypothetical protein
MPSSGMLSRMAVVRTTRRNISEDGVFHNHRRENMKSSVFIQIYLKIS